METTQTAALTDLEQKIASLTVANLDHTSKDWDKRTKNILLFMEGAGSMFGGWSQIVHITLHGENSVTPTGTITLNGVITSGYNIARGANGDNSGSLIYYKGAKSFDGLTADNRHFTLNYTGEGGGLEEAACSILSASQDWLIK